MRPLLDTDIEYGVAYRTEAQAREAIAIVTSLGLDWIVEPTYVTSPKGWLVERAHGWHAVAAEGAVDTQQINLALTAAGLNVGEEAS